MCNATETHTNRVLNHSFIPRQMYPNALWDGIIEYDILARHADPEVCPVGALAFWLFYTFQIAGCNIDFSERYTW